MKMYKNRRFDFKEFRRVVSGLEENGLSYFVFGGFALDGINGELAEHGDLDIVFYERDRPAIAPFFRNLGYSTYLHGRKEDYRLNLNGYSERKVDSLLLKDLRNYYELMGNRVKDKISKEAFGIFTKVNVEGTEFNIMPYEWFSLYLNQHCDSSKLDKTNDAIKRVFSLCRPLDILSQEKVDRPVNQRRVEL